MDTRITDTQDEDEDVLMFVSELISVFDDFLWAHNVVLHNAEPKVDDWGDPSIIYGSQYKELQNSLMEVFQLYDVT